MKTPAQLWQKSGREYQLRPAQWIYPSGTELAEVDRSGSIRIDGRRWYLTQTLVDQLVGVTAVGPRFLVHYRRTLIAEIDPLKSRSTAVDRD